MLGGGSNGNKGFPSFAEESHNQFALPQLQLFGHVPIPCAAGVNTTNYMGGGHMPTDNLPINLVREGDTLSVQQKLQISLNNYCQDETVRIGTVVNPNPVSTGLKLSCEEEERNSSVTSACENMKTTPVGLSLGTAVQIEIDRQTEEFCRYIKLQEESILKGVREINQRHTVSLLNALEKGVAKKLHEKEREIESMNKKNKELGDRIKQVAMEAQSWHHQAKYNESVINVLKSNIQQLIAQGTTGNAREGSGDSEVDDAVSSSNHQAAPSPASCPPKCKVCGGRRHATVLILPCRHLCLCTDCDGFVNACPVCQVMKTASVHVYM